MAMPPEHADTSRAIKQEGKKPFEGVLEGLKYAHSMADIAIVSSANLQAVEEEWRDGSQVKGRNCEERKEGKTIRM